jgi:serine/threonine-protein kinase
VDLEPQAIGRYDLLLELGRGGMAVLHLARARGVGGFSKLFAIKQILPHLAVDPPFVDMFLNEGRIAARLSHPNLCPVFELGSDRGELYLVMEYLDGVPWDALSAAMPRDPRGLALTAGVLAQACEGLHYAHTFRDVHGTLTPIVHRDVSPQNLFVSADGVCRMLDFGVSKIASDRRRTGTGLLKGKLPYMAPEQIQGELADPRADIWAVGVMLWEALTGERLFDRETDFLTYQAILSAPIPSVNAASMRYPPAVDQVIARVLGRDRDVRYSTARDLGRDLARIAADVGGAATRDQIAEAVSALCGDRLAARRRAIAVAIARRSQQLAAASDLSTDAPTPATDGRPTPAAPPTTGEAAETISMMMRRDAIAVERPRRRRWWTAVLPLAALAAVVLIISTRRITSEPPPNAIAVDRQPTVAGTDPISTIDPIAGNSTTRNPTTRDSATRDSATRDSATRDSATRDSATRDSATTGSRVASSTTAHRGTAPAPSPTASADESSSKRPARSPRAPPTSHVASPPRAGAPSTTAPSLAASGWYAIDSNPYATIFIDERKIGDTPLDRIPLTAGTHRVRAVLADGRQRTFAIDITADQKTSSGTLAW